MMITEKVSDMIKQYRGRPTKYAHNKVVY
jgi:hypothetical protein